MSNNEKETARTGNSMVVIDPQSLLPIVDAHMHIQSNDIAPLPIMNGILRLKLLGSMSFIQNLFKLKKINFTEISFRDSEIKRSKILQHIFVSPNPTKIEDRKFITNTTAITTYGKVTRSNSYSIAGLYMNESIETDLAFPSRWKIMYNTIYVDENDAKEFDKNRDKIIEKRIDLERKFEKEENKKDWYEIKTYTKTALRFECIMGMELMYSHYWGAYGIPIYITGNGKLYAIDNSPEYIEFKNNQTVNTRLYYQYDINPKSIKKVLFLEDKKENICYINQIKRNLTKIREKIKYTKLNNKEDVIFERFEDEIFRYIENIKDEKEFNKYFKEIKNIFSFQRKDSFLKYLKELNSGYFFSDESDIDVSTLQDIKKAFTLKLNLRDFVRMKSFSEKEKSDIHYSIFLQEMPESEKWQFEEHDVHVNYQKMAALKYPLQYLPFYHLDVRRFFAPTNRIEENFYFYIPTKDNGIYELDLKGSIQETLSQTTTIDYRDPFKIKQCFTYKKEIEELKAELINSDGLFWGIKMYVALGYPPYLGIENNISKKIFPRLNDDDYIEFKNFLAFCGKENIPITCHCSPQGMTIADSEIYLKEWLKRQEDDGEEKFAYFEPTAGRMLEGLGLIDDFSSPESWEIVLDSLKKDIPSSKLTLCLAHFGGKPFFIDKYKIMPLVGKKDDRDDYKNLRKEKYPYSWQEKIAQLIQRNYHSKNHNIYTDLSNFMFDLKSFPHIIDETDYNALKRNRIVKDFVEKYFTILAEHYYKIHNLDLNNLEKYASKTDDENKKKLKEALLIRFAMIDCGIVCREIKTATKNLVELINKYDGIQHRIMYGTDYPMFEGDVNGVGYYMSSSVIFYQYLTYKLNFKFDAFLQFCVINPLKFLGVLKDSSGNLCTSSNFNETSEIFYIDKTKLEKMKNNLENWYEYNSTSKCNEQNDKQDEYSNKQNEDKEIYSTNNEFIEKIKRHYDFDNFETNLKEQFNIINKFVEKQICLKKTMEEFKNIFELRENNENR